MDATSVFNAILVHKQSLLISDWIQLWCDFVEVVEIKKKKLDFIANYEKVHLHLALSEATDVLTTTTLLGLNALIRCIVTKDEPRFFVHPATRSKVQ